MNQDDDIYEDEDYEASKDNALEEFSLFDEEDQAILMQRDAHFGGNFSIMEDYYAVDGNKGIVPEIEMSRIQYLSEIEKQKKENLAGIMLSGADAERIARSRAMYRQLRDICEVEETKNPIPSLIAGLILTESEEEEEAISNVIEQGRAVVPFLLDVIHNADLHDTLFPGYGQAPFLAARCLGLLADDRAINSLFEMIGEADLFDEEYILTALKQIGKPAKDFLLRVLQKPPYTVDNEKAAIALLRFKDEPLVAAICLGMLQDPAAWKHPLLCSYLLFVCEGLTEIGERQLLLELKGKKGFPGILGADIDMVQRSWHEK